MGRLSAVDPESQRTVELLSRMYRALGETPRAIGALQRRLDAAPEDVETMRMLTFTVRTASPKSSSNYFGRSCCCAAIEGYSRVRRERRARPRSRRDEAFAFDKDQIMALAAEPRPTGVLRRTLRDLPGDDCLRERSVESLSPDRFSATD
ncbi:MAG: hypothetical protein U0165_01735 [Polyangiaceae bacterium]